MRCEHAIETGGGSALNRACSGWPRSSTSVRLSCLGCLLSLAWFACSASVSFPCITITPLCAQLCSVPDGVETLRPRFHGYPFTILWPGK